MSERGEGRRLGQGWVVLPSDMDVALAGVKSLLNQSLLLKEKCRKAFSQRSITCTSNYIVKIFYL